jgi:hypothetical protein
MAKVRIDVDLAWGDEEELADALERMAKRCESAWVRIVRASGPAGGWPLVEIELDESDLEKFADFYWGADRDLWSITDLNVRPA